MVSEINLYFSKIKKSVGSCRINIQFIPLKGVWKKYEKLALR